MDDIIRAREILTEALRKGCLQLFAEHDVSANDDAPDIKPSFAPGVARLAACIGFAHPSVKGALTAYIPATLLANTLPVATRDPRPEELRDWAGEIVNQLLGRMKNAFLAYGIDLPMGIPSIIVGTDYEVVSPREARGSWHSFGCSGQLMFVHLDTIIDPKLELGEPSVDESTIAAEGDAMLF
jgi:hypothetical protein